MDSRNILGLIMAGMVSFAGLPDSGAAQAEPDGRDWSFAVESEPVAYAFDGAGGTLAYRTGPWTVSLEGFTLSRPESLHGNEGFESSTSGVQVQLERYLGGGREGFYLGPEIGVSELEVTHRESGITEQRVGTSVGARFGYHWQIGLGGLYLSPVAGISYSLASEDISAGGVTFERTAATPWATVGIGWTF